jgi:glycosyltransferase involved in cell wall biosynthesis
MHLPAELVRNLGTNAVIAGMPPPRPPDAAAANLIVSVGRLSPEKGHDVLLRAFARLPRTLDARLVIAGDGPGRSGLEALAQSLAIAPRVRFAGFVPDPGSLLARAALFVSASRFEGLGNAMVEALAWGVPVVSTDAPYGPREILAGGALGRLVPVGDAAALADAIEASLQQSHDPEPLRRRALDFTVERAAHAFRALLIEAGVPLPPAP